MQNRAAPVGKTFRPVKNVVTAPGAAELPERELQGAGAWENEFQTGSDNTGAWTGRCSTCGCSRGLRCLSLIHICYRNPIIREDDIVVAVSQSGETADTLAAVELARKAGAFVFGICKDVYKRQVSVLSVYGFLL